ncbi:MAG: InlB B-repeat-containing protein, partial [Spirochaetia bacterium]|nr:InlB B-repeat-containing protein [Spirochaetia bacterium]
MKKYLLLAVMALAAVGMVLTGCSNGSSGWEPSDDYGQAITITFNANGHGTAPEPIKARANQEIEMPQMAAADGYVNTSWYLDAACQTGSKAVGTWQKFTRNTTLYGYWTNQKFNIIWNVNDPDVEPIANTQPYAHSAVAFPATPVHPDGYEFMGWFTTASGAEKVAADYEITKDEEFFAQWGRPIEVTWSVDGNTSYYTPAQLPEQKNCGYLQFPATDPVGEKPFAGWYDAEDNAATAETIVHDGDVYYAKWGYAIVLSGNGDGTDGKAGVVDNGTQLSINPAPARAGYAVMAYFKDSGCETKIAGADGKLAANVSGLTDADGKWIAGTDSTFYVKWGKKLGGTIYYVDDRDTADYKTNAASCYTFYDADGNELEAAEDLTKHRISFTLDGENAKAVYYEVTGAGDKDRYYVAGTKLATTYPWAFGPADAAISSTNYRQENLQAILGGDPLHQGSGHAADYQGTAYLGRGKGDTETMLYYDPADENADGEYGPYAGGKFGGMANATMDKY